MRVGLGVGGVGSCCGILGGVEGGFSIGTGCKTFWTVLVVLGTTGATGGAVSPTFSLPGQ